jgi:hypothetical protein
MSSSKIQELVNLYQPIDHHSGQGDMLLAETLACMNIFAFLFHTEYNFETLYN